jgi:DNA invertase Pin-like site-specific DNA recombinase
MSANSSLSKMRVAIYTRISTGEQNADMQCTELTDYCNFRKWDLVKIYSDVISGSKDRRPSLDQLMADAKRGKFDVLVVWRFDRFARSTRFLLESLELFNGLGIDFVSLRESIDTSTATGKLVFTILGAVAELERSNIRERVVAGQKAAKRRGVRFGRPEVRVDIREIEALRKQGQTWREIALAMGTSEDTLLRRVQKASLGSLTSALVESRSNGGRNRLVGD